jgi:hypothetical protein
MSNVVRSRKSSSSSKLSNNSASNKSLLHQGPWNNINGAAGDKKPNFSKKIIYTLILTNILSLLLGAGIG